MAITIFSIFDALAFCVENFLRCCKDAKGIFDHQASTRMTVVIY